MDLHGHIEVMCVFGQGIRLGAQVLAMALEERGIAVTQRELTKYFEQRGIITGTFRDIRSGASGSRLGYIGVDLRNARPAPLALGNPVTQAQPPQGDTPPPGPPKGNKTHIHANIRTLATLLNVPATLYRKLQMRFLEGTFRWIYTQPDGFEINFEATAVDVRGRYQLKEGKPFPFPIQREAAQPPSDTTTNQPPQAVVTAPNPKLGAATPQPVHEVDPIASCAVGNISIINATGSISVSENDELPQAQSTVSPPLRLPNYNDDKDIQRYEDEIVTFYNWAVGLKALSYVYVAIDTQRRHILLKKIKYDGCLQHDETEFITNGKLETIPTLPCRWSQDDNEQTKRRTLLTWYDPMLIVPPAPLPNEEKTNANYVYRWHYWFWSTVNILAGKRCLAAHKKMKKLYDDLSNTFAMYWNEQHCYMFDLYNSLSDDDSFYKHSDKLISKELRKKFETERTQAQTIYNLEDCGPVVEPLKSTIWRCYDHDDRKFMYKVSVD